MKQAFHYINVLSIDVAFGAVCSALFFAKLFHVIILPYGLISLALTVWLIYSIDHLMDAKRIKYPASTIRHRFYQEKYHMLVKVVVFIAILDAIMVLWIRRPVFVGGVYIAAAVLLYLVINRFMQAPKEIIIAFLYTGGILLPSAAVTKLPADGWPWALILQFFITVLINLVLFSWFDRTNDVNDKTSSLVIFLGQRKSKVLIWLLFIIAGFLPFFSTTQSGSAIILLMDFMFLLIYLFPEYFSKSDRYRLIGDAVFFLPIFLLL